MVNQSRTPTLTLQKLFLISGGATHWGDGDVIDVSWQWRPCLCVMLLRGGCTGEDQTQTYWGMFWTRGAMEKVQLLFS